MYVSRTFLAKFGLKTGVDRLEQLHADQDKNCFTNSLNLNFKMLAIQEVNARIDRVHKQLLEVKEKKTERLDKVGENKQNFVDEIRKIRTELNSHLDQLEEKALNDLDTIAETQLQKELKTESENVERHIVNLKKLKDSLNDGTKRAEVDETINNAKMFINISSRVTSLSLKMTPNSEFIKSVLETTSLASFDFKRTEAPTANARVKLEAKLFTEQSVENSNREYPRYISCICQLADNTYVLADTNNNEVVQVNQEFNTTCALAVEDGPYGMCLVDVNELAVRLCNKTIQIVDTSESTLTLKTKIYIGETPYSCGFAFCNGLYWSSGYCGINLYKMNGDRVKSITNEVNGVKPFQKGQPEDIAVSKDGTEIFVTDSKNGVLVFSNDGKYRMSLTDDRLRQTKGVAVSDDGMVIVAGFNSRNIVAFNPDLNTSNVLVTTKGMPGYPVSLHYDNKQNRLLIGCNNSKVLVLEMKN
ncbi:hypothetical protein ACF0H5_021241 [Mactra antiquata]